MSPLGVTGRLQGSGTRPPGKAGIPAMAGYEEVVSLPCRNRHLMGSGASARPQQALGGITQSL